VEIIPQLSLEELTQIVQKVDESVSELDQKIEASENTAERKALRRERNTPNKRESVRGKSKVENERGLASKIHGQQLRNY
jgi:hypothetical protein